MTPFAARFPPFVASDLVAVGAMLRAAQVGPDDLVIDLGSGDGRIPITAAKGYGARGVCVDLDPVRIAESRRLAELACVTERIEFIEGDLFEADLSEATVVALHLSPATMQLLAPKLREELRPGARIVSNGFDLGPDWEPDQVLDVPRAQTCVYLWTIPADETDGRQS